MGPTIKTIIIQIVEAAGADDEYTAPVCTSGEWRLIGASYSTDVAVTLSDSTYTTLSLKQGSTTLGSITTQTTGSGGADLSAVGNVASFSLSGGASLEFGSTDCIQLHKDDTSSGAVAEGAMCLDFEKVA